MFPGPVEPRFNASLIEHRGRLILAYRTRWAGARVNVCQLGPDLTPGPGVALHRLRRPQSWYGREDPRLFLHGGRLHVSFSGVEMRGGRLWVSQMFARLSDALQVEDVFAPHFPGGHGGWEKNWGFFDPGDGLRAVYQVRPHVVVRVRSDAAELESRTDWRGCWSGGHLRGGASPVRVGDVYYCWFHGRTDRDLRYNVGLYTFAATPPFRVLRYTPDPLLWADPATRPADQYCPVVFPGGAVLRGDRWLVSIGVHDRWTEIVEWDAGAVESALVPVR